MPSQWWAYENRQSYNQRRASDFQRRMQPPAPRVRQLAPAPDFATPAPEPSFMASQPMPSLPELPDWAYQQGPSFSDPYGNVSLGSIGRGALQTAGALLEPLSWGQHYVAQPLAGAISAAIMPGQQFNIDPRAGLWEQMQQGYSQARQIEETRPELFGADVNVPLLGRVHLGEKMLTESALDPLNWLGVGEVAALSKVRGLRALAEAADVAGDVGRAASLFRQAETLNTIANPLRALNAVQDLPFRAALAPVKWAGSQAADLGGNLFRNLVQEGAARDFAGRLLKEETGSLNLGALGRQAEEVAAEPWQMTRAEYEQGTVLHGTTPDFQGFRPQSERTTGHGVTYFSDPARTPGRKTQAEHIAQGPFGGKLVRARLGEGKRFDPYNDPQARAIAEQVVPGYGTETKMIEYGHAPDIVRAAQPLGYNRFGFYEPSVQGFSEAVTDPSLIEIVPEHRQVVEQALTEGKPVPSQVLADYPDLAAKYAAPAAQPDPFPAYSSLRPDDPSSVTNIGGMEVRKISAIPPELAARPGAEGATAFMDKGTNRVYILDGLDPQGVTDALQHESIHEQLPPGMGATAEEQAAYAATGEPMPRAAETAARVGDVLEGAPAQPAPEIETSLDRMRREAGPRQQRPVAPEEGQAINDLAESRRAYDDAMRRGALEEAESIRPVIEADAQEATYTRSMNEALWRHTGTTPDVATAEDWQRTVDALENEVNDLQQQYTREGVQGQAQLARAATTEKSLAFGREMNVTRGRISRAEEARVQRQLWDTAQGDMAARYDQVLVDAGYTKDDLATATLEDRRRLAEEVAQGDLARTSAGKPAKIDDVPVEARRDAVLNAPDVARRQAAAVSGPGGELDLPGLDASKKYATAQAIRARVFGENVGELGDITPDRDLAQWLPEQNRPAWSAESAGGAGEPPVPGSKAAAQFGGGGAPPPKVPRLPGAGPQDIPPTPVDPEAQKQLLRQALTAPEQTWRERLGDTAWKLVRDYYDKLYPLKGIEQKTGIKAYTLARLSSGSETAGLSLIDQYVRPVLDSVGADVKRLEEYMTAERMNDLLALNPDARLPGGVTHPSAALKSLEAELGAEKFAQIQTAAQKLWDLNDQLVLKPYLDNGIISQEAYAAIRERWPHYIPFQRQDYAGDVLAGIGGGKAAASAPGSVLKAIDLLGSEKALDNPLAHLQAQVVKAQTVMARNKAAEATIQGLQEFGRLTNQPLVKIGETAQTVERGTIQYIKDGQRIVAQVPKLYADVAKGLEAETANGLDRLLSAMAQPLKTGAVNWNPAFLAVNPIRDLISAWFREGVNPFSAEYLQGWMAAITKNTDFREAAAAGALGGGITGVGRTTGEMAAVRRLGGIKVNNAADALLFLPHMIERGNEIGESATRVATWIKLRNEGVEEIERALRVRDVTVDFSKSGNATKTLNRMIPFLNAGIQGSANTARMVMSNPKQALVRSAPLGMASILAYCWNQRYETSSLIPEYEYANNWIIQVGEGQQNADPRYPDQPGAKFPIYIKVPKGPMGAFLTAPVETGLRVAFAQDDRSVVEHLLSGARTAALAMSPIEPSASAITPPLLGAGLQIQQNRDFFRDRAIIPQGELNRPAAEQYGSETSKTAVALGQAFGVSPRMIDFAIQDVTGGGGTTVSWLSDLALGALGYNPVVPGAVGAKAARSLTGPEETAGLPVVGRFLGVRGTEPQRVGYDKLDRELARARTELYRNPEVKKYGLGITMPSDSITIDGEQQPLTTDQRIWLLKESMPLQRVALDELADQEWYRAADPAEQRKMLEHVRSKIGTNLREALSAQMSGGAGHVWSVDEAQLLVQAMGQRAEYESLSRYRGMTDEQVQRANRANSQISEMVRTQRGMTTDRARMIYRRIDPEGVRLGQMLSKRTSPERKRYWQSHPLLEYYYGNLDEGTADMLPQYQNQLQAAG